MTNKNQIIARRKRIHNDERLTIRVTKEQKDTVIMAARKARVTMSLWIIEKLGV